MLTLATVALIAFFVLPVAATAIVVEVAQS